jgi:hypothetical protein
MANTTNIDLVKPAGTDHALISVINSNSDKIDAEAGRQRGNFAGTYSSTSGYAVGDYCIYQGNLYRCTTAIGSSGENWTAGHWTSVKVGTELKGLSDQIVTLNSKIKAYRNTYTFDSNAICNTGIQVTSNAGISIMRNTSSVSAVMFSYYVNNGILYITGYVTTTGAPFASISTDLSIIVINE